MKQLLIMLSFFAMISCGTSEEDTTVAEPIVAGASTSTSSKLTTIEWIEPSKNFGKIKEGQTLNISFRFRNTGKVPLIIESVQPACGCTVADYPKKPIPPGAEGEITGSFDSKGREGLNQKQIQVVANTEGSANHQVEFTVEVVKGKSE